MKWASFVDLDKLKSWILSRKAAIWSLQQEDREETKLNNEIRIRTFKGFFISMLRLVDNVFFL